VKVAAGSREDHVMLSLVMMKCKTMLWLKTQCSTKLDKWPEPERRTQIALSEICITARKCYHSQRIIFEGQKHLHNLPKIISLKILDFDNLLLQIFACD
jgi:hypothetical protein